jgi:hypothetical protein
MLIKMKIEITPGSSPERPLSLEETVELFNTASTDLLVQARHFSKRPNRLRGELLNSSGNSLVEVFRSTATTIANLPDWNEDEKKAIISSLVRKDDLRRIEKFKRMTGMTIEPYDIDDLFTLDFPLIAGEESIEDSAWANIACTHYGQIAITSVQQLMDRLNDTQIVPSLASRIVTRLEETVVGVKRPDISLNDIRNVGSMAVGFLRDQLKHF